MNFTLLLLQLLSLSPSGTQKNAPATTGETVVVTQLKVYMHTWKQEDGTFYYPDSSMQLVGTVSLVNEGAKGTEARRVGYNDQNVPTILLLKDPLQFAVSDSSCELALLSVLPEDQSPGIKAATILAKFPFRFTDPLFKQHPANIIFRNEDTVVEMELQWN